MNKTQENESIIGRLLEELSWSGKTIKKYRGGGVGYENVLSAEVFQALDFLPRVRYLGEILKASCGADQARLQLIKDVENAKIKFLPGNQYLISKGIKHQDKLSAQPDAIIETQDSFVIVEAKRILGSSFQTEQLTREFVLALRNANNRTPLLFLILSKEPPIEVKRLGRVDIAFAINKYLKKILEKSDNHSIEEADAIEKIPSVVCWITWKRLLEVVQNTFMNEKNLDISTHHCIERLTNSIKYSIKGHSVKS